MIVPPRSKDQLPGSLHYFVILLIILLGVLLSMLTLAMIYFLTPSSNQALLDQITFSTLATTFGNGILADQLWPSAVSIDPKAVLAKLRGIRTFLAVTNWFRPASLTDPTLPYYFSLPETALSVKTFLAASSGIDFTLGVNNDLVGFLLTPKQVAFKFALDGVINVPEKIFTGADVLAGGGLQDLAVIIIYTIS